MAVIDSFCAKDTYELGEKIGQMAKPGMVISLTGDLGVGKTVFTQGLAKGLGIEEPVNSPTFTIVQVYEEGRLPCIILMYIGLAILKRWTRSVMRIISMERAYA